MILPKMQGSRVSEKNISAFYGVNRTAKINDFQLSEMKNMDCETFPFAATRKSREKIYPLEAETQSAMRLICGDTDLEDDYLVTGITQDGEFIYRGEEVSGTSEVDFSGVSYMMEYMGDYVLFPNMEAITVTTEEENGKPAYSAEVNTASVAEPFDKKFNGSKSYNYSHEPFVVGNNSIRVKFEADRRGNLISAVPCVEFESRFAAGDFYTGLSFKMNLYCRYGKLDGTVREEYRCPIPNDVYMVMDRVYFVDENENEILYGQDNLEANAEYYICIDFSAYTITGEKVLNLSQYFLENAIIPEGEEEPRPSISGNFCAGFVAGNDNLNWYWNDVELLFISPPMVLGAAFGGRLFGCDTLGVSVYYSYASGERYNFNPSASAGGAGFVLSADPGKWTAMCAFNNALYVFKRDAMYRIYSSDGLAFYMERIADVGATGNEAVCVVDNVMYFLSSNGLYAFSGSYPQPLPDSLGRTYLRGVLGGDNGKLFCSLAWKENEVFKRELCVYHIDKGIFSVHDDFAAKQFVWFGGELYALEESGVVWRMDSVREAVEFCLDTKQYFFSFQKKAVSAARIYFEFDPAGDDGYFEILVSTDNGEFIPATPKLANGRVRYVPIKFKKCDEFRIRICGEGVFTLKGISFALYQGGDVKQNR